MSDKISVPLPELKKPSKLALRLAAKALVDTEKEYVSLDEWAEWVDDYWADGLPVGGWGDE